MRDSEEKEAKVSAKRNASAVAEHDGTTHTGPRDRPRRTGEALRADSGGCEWCGAHFEMRRRHGSPRRFCSTDCRLLAWCARRLQAAGFTVGRP